VLGVPALAADARFATNAARVANREALVSALESRTTTEPGDRWIDALSSEQIPCGRVHDVPAAIAYAREVGLEPVVDTPREDGTTVPTVANPIRMSLTPPTYRMAPPRLGEHTASALADLEVR
jgi:crotonobetainyl-CoA:carnitine CoA-transferase CaiB-like acyl-CoA transferase